MSGLIRNTLPTFYRADRKGQIRDNHVDGAPDLVVEVLSPRTAYRDVGPKFAEYEQYGVVEYTPTITHALARIQGG